jgi:hypothetical protein
VREPPNDERGEESLESSTSHCRKWWELQRDVDNATWQLTGKGGVIGRQGQPQILGHQVHQEPFEELAADDVRKLEKHGPNQKHGKTVLQLLALLEVSAWPLQKKKKSTETFGQRVGQIICNQQCNGLLTLKPVWW